MKLSLEKHLILLLVKRGIENINLLENWRKRPGLVFFPSTMHLCWQTQDGDKLGTKAGSIEKLSVLRRSKHRREAAPNVIMVELCIRVDPAAQRALVLGC